MKLKCSLDPEQYPNCSRVHELVKECCSETPGELALNTDPDADDRVCLQFWHAATAKRSLLYSWSVNACVFRLPDSLHALEQVTRRFLQTLPERNATGIVK